MAFWSEEGFWNAYPMDLRVGRRYMLRLSKQAHMFQAPSSSVQDERSCIRAHYYVSCLGELEAIVPVDRCRLFLNSLIEALVSQTYCSFRSSELVEDVAEIVAVERGLAPLEELCIISLAYKPSQQTFSYSVSPGLGKPLAFI